MNIEQRIETFLAAPAFGVVGASAKPEKYGHNVLRCYLQNGRRAIPVNPVETTIAGQSCVKSVSELPDEVTSISVITPPQVTEQVVEQALARGIKNIWMQPGAESPAAIASCEAAGINLIADGSCVLIMGYHEH